MIKILAIDTSADETSAAVTEGRKILSNVMFSQIPIHAQWGGIVPDKAKRAHEERISPVIDEALKKAGVTLDDIDAIAVTYGPGLAIALGVGIQKAKELAHKHNKKLIGVNHLEGHIYSCFAQDAQGQPDSPLEYPYLALLVSGGHTEIVLLDDDVSYTILGSTRDDAAGEAIDKAARLITGDKIYPGGPVIERLAKDGDPAFMNFPRPMSRDDSLDFSYSGLKTALLYIVEDMSQEELDKHRNDLAASFQKAVFDSILIKLKKAMKKHSIKNVCVGGGVVANELLRERIEEVVKDAGGYVALPPFRDIYGDNAAMIGIAASYHAKKGDFVKDPDSFDRNARARLC